MGQTKTRQILIAANVSPTTRLREMTPLRRAALVLELRVKAATYRTALARVHDDIAAAA